MSTNQAAQRVRRNGSPSTTKQGPMKAVKAFSLKQGSSHSKNASQSSPSPREGHHKLWSRKSPPEHRVSPERKSPGSISPKEKSKSHRLSPVPGKWRASSADTVVPSYLTGQWPKDINSYHHYQSTGVFMCDKSTQTIEEWENKKEKKKRSHRRSASFGQGDQLKLQFIKQHLQKSKEGSKQLENGKQRSSPVPANHSALSLTAPPTVFAQQTKTILCNAGLIPRQSMNRFQRNSVEGLNVEIEKLVSSVKILTTADTEECDAVFKQDIPDGHRAPIPEINRLSCTRSVDTQTPSGQLDHSITPNTTTPSSLLPVAIANTTTNRSRSASISPASASTPPRPGSLENTMVARSRSDSTDSKSSKETSPEPSICQVSPKLVKSCPFVREPPDGCEKVTVVEESRRPQIKEPMLFTPVKPNQFEFKQSQGSAFCPLIKSLYLDSEFPITHHNLSPSIVTSTSIES